MRRDGDPLPAGMRRIAIVGPGGAGKSTLARRLSKVLGLPVIHLDRLYWKPGWVPTPRDEWVRLQGELLASDRWIVDGNYGSTMDMRLAAADTVVFMDLPRVVCVWRAFHRGWSGRGRTRPDMADGCPERIDLGFLWWIWTYPRRHRPTLARKLAALPDDKRVVRLRSHRDVRAFVRGLEAGPAGRSPA